MSDEYLLTIKRTPRGTSSYQLTYTTGEKTMVVESYLPNVAKEKPGHSTRYIPNHVRDRVNKIIRVLEEFDMPAEDVGADGIEIKVCGKNLRFPKIKDKDISK